jgi:RNA polymerase subunit RPABC4/transcription elongation factor Spt4
MLLPLIEQFFNSDESGAHDPLIQALDQQLDSEMPGYKDHGDPHAAQELLMVLKPKGDGDTDEGSGIEGEPTKIEQKPEDDSDDNESKPSEKESRVEFLPYLPTLEASNDPHFRVALAPPTPGTTGVGLMPGMPPVTPNAASPTVQGRCPHCGAVTDPSNTTCPQCGAATSMLPGHQGKTAELAPDNSFMYEHTDLPPGMPLNQQSGKPIEHSWSSETCPKCHSVNDPGEPACIVCGTPSGAKSHGKPHERWHPTRVLTHPSRSVQSSRR